MSDPTATANHIVTLAYRLASELRVAHLELRALRTAVKNARAAGRCDHKFATQGDRECWNLLVPEGWACVAWCKRCGAIKVGDDGEWALPHPKVAKRKGKR